MPRSEDAPMILEPPSYNEIFDLMVTQPAPPEWSVTYLHETSFAGNMPFLTENNPDVFLFTHKSAIPVADSVRAYYEELGMNVPELGVINTKASTLIRDKAGQEKGGEYSVPDEVLERELAQLGTVLEGKKVAILDQYIYHRGTVTRAYIIAREAGATAVRFPGKTNWYNDAHAEDIDFDALTSVHSEFMKRVGHAAARFEVPPTWRIIYADLLTPDTSTAK